MIPLRTDRPLRTTPWVNFSLIVVNVFVFVALNSLPDEMKVRIETPLELWPRVPPPFEGMDPSSIRYNAQPHLWQFVTSMFLHGGFWHIAGNMLFLWIFGNLVEDKLGHVRYLLFYLAGGIFAGIGHSLVSAHPAIGASGAISAVLGAFLVFFPNTKVRILWFFILITVFDLPSMWFIGFCIARDLWMQFLPGPKEVAYMAHISGSFTGIGVALLLLWWRIFPREPYDLITMISQWKRRREFRVVTRKGYDPWGRRGSRTRRSAQYDHNRRPDASESSPTGESSLLSSLTKDPAVTEKASDTAAIRRSESKHSIHEAISAGIMTEAARQFRKLLDEFPDAIMNQDDQLALANQFFAEKDHPLAEQTYQRFLATYPAADPQGEVRLMLGLTLARYLNRPDDARPLLEEAAKRLGKGGNHDLAAELLQELNPS